jgi:casein kinase 1
MPAAGLAPGASQRQDRRRSQQGPIPPSPALVRNGSARRKIPTTLAAGQQTPASGAAQVGVPAPGNGSMDRRQSAQRLSAHHPFASAQGSYEFTQDGADPYGRQSPMVSSVGPAPPDARIGANHPAPQQQDEPAPPSGLWKILTCRCG